VKKKSRKLFDKEFAEKIAKEDKNKRSMELMKQAIEIERKQRESYFFRLKCESFLYSEDQR
jgi:hypothetical protein